MKNISGTIIIKMSKFTSHTAISPTNLTWDLLILYKQSISPIFFDIYTFLNDIPSTKKDKKWNTIQSMIASQLSDTKDQELHKKLIHLVPKSQQFRYQRPKNQSYYKALVEFASILKDIDVQSSTGIDKLWKTFTVDTNETIGTLEAKILAMLGVLQWEYQVFFDTSLFYWYFKPYHTIMLPGLLSILHRYTTKFY